MRRLRRFASGPRTDSSTVPSGMSKISRPVKIGALAAFNNRLLQADVEQRNHCCSQACAPVFILPHRNIIIYVAIGLPGCVFWLYAVLIVLSAPVGILFNKTSQTWRVCRSLGLFLPTLMAYLYPDDDDFGRERVQQQFHHGTR